MITVEGVREAIRKLKEPTPYKPPRFWMHHLEYEQCVAAGAIERDDPTWNAYPDTVAS